MSTGEKIRIMTPSRRQTKIGHQNASCEGVAERNFLLRRTPEVFATTPDLC
jgi:hypothetical protein